MSTVIEALEQRLAALERMFPQPIPETVTYPRMVNELVQECYCEKHAMVYTRNAHPTWRPMQWVSGSCARCDEEKIARDQRNAEIDRRLKAAVPEVWEQVQRDYPDIGQSAAEAVKKQYSLYLEQFPDADISEEISAEEMEQRNAVFEYLMKERRTQIELDIDSQGKKKRRK